MNLQPAQQLPDLLATADIHLLPQKAEAADMVMPSKLIGMLASAHAGTELATVVQTCGLVVPPGDAVAFAQAVRGLAADPALRKQMGTAGFLYAKEHLDREAVLGVFEAQLNPKRVLFPAPWGVRKPTVSEGHCKTEARREACES